MAGKVLAPALFKAILEPLSKMLSGPEFLDSLVAGGVPADMIPEMMEIWAKAHGIDDQVAQIVLMPPSPMTEKVGYASPPAYHKSTKDLWGTPWSLLERIKQLAGVEFDLDPCALESNAKAPIHYGPDMHCDGLEMHWFGNVFMNPPYSQVEKWMAKMWQEIEEKRVWSACALVAARPDTKWWWEAMMNCQAIWFLKGRVKFIEENGQPSKTSAPFPSACIWMVSQDHPHFHKEPLVAWVDPMGTGLLGQPMFDLCKPILVPTATPGMWQEPAPHTVHSQAAEVR